MQTSNDSWLPSHPAYSQSYRWLVNVLFGDLHKCHWKSLRNGKGFNKKQQQKMRGRQLGVTACGTSRNRKLKSFWLWISKILKSLLPFHWSRNQPDQAYREKTLKTTVQFTLNGRPLEQTRRKCKATFRYQKKSVEKWHWDEVVCCCSCLLICFSRGDSSADKKISRFSREFSNTGFSRYCDFAEHLKASWGSSWLLIYLKRRCRLTKINFTIKVKAVGPDFPRDSEIKEMNVTRFTDQVGKLWSSSRQDAMSQRVIDKRTFEPKTCLN